MERFFKRKFGLIILIIIALVFPISLSNQARLSNRIIVTGLAVDKVGDEYEVTAQIVKTTPGTESAGKSAMVNFVSDSDKTMVGALAKLTYKAGKVAAFSHTNFVILGETLFEENLSEVLDYFVRHKMIKSSAMVLFCEGKASDEIQKTKDVELSVGLGLQKVFLFKENEGDGEMTTILKFLNDSKSNSKTSTASSLKLMKNDEKKKDESSDDSKSSSSSESNSGEGSSENTQSSGEEGGSGSNYQYFEALSPIVCCKNGEYAGRLEEKDEITGYMIVKNKAESEDISLDSVYGGRFNDAKVGVKVNNKHTYKKIRYENGMPKLDISVVITDSEIEDLKNVILISELKKEEYEIIKEEIKKDTSKKVVACFEKAKSLNVDIFRAYDLAIKYNYNDTKRLYDGLDEFLNDLTINVDVEVVRLNY